MRRLYTLANIRSIRLETIFLLIFALFSIIYIVSIPLGWNTDEANHAYRIYQLASGDLLAEKVITPGTGLKAYGGPVPTNLIRLFDITGSNQPGGIGNPNNKVTSHWYARSTGIYALRDNDQRTSYYFSGSALYSPVTYAPYLPVVWLGDLLSAPLFWVLILCRIVGALTVCLAFYVAIRYTPVGKWAFFTVGLLPGVVIQATTVGADAPQLAAIILFLLLVVKRIYSPELLQWWYFLLLGGLGADIALVKFAYAPIVLLLFALPLVQDVYRRRSTVLWLVLTVIIALIPSLIWTHMVSYIDINSNPLANFSSQTRFVLSQPLTYLEVLYYTYFTNQQQPLDNLFGGLILLPAVYSYIATIVITLSMFVHDRREKMADVLSRLAMRRWRWILIAVIALTVATISSALYIYSTPLHQSSIMSIQSRYFLPLLPLLLLALYGNRLKNQRVVKSSILFLSCLLLIGTSLMIYHRLYQTLPLIIKT